MSLEIVKELLRKNKKLLIAIEGPSGAGKSTLSSQLSEAFNALVFHTDDYFLHPRRKTKKRLGEAGGNLDYERMESEIFAHLDETFITSNHFNCLTNELEERTALKRSDLIIIEGVYSMHPNFIKYYDYTIFLSIKKDTQYARILKRSNEFMLARFKNEWIPLEDYYFETLNIEEKADFIIHND